MWIVPVVPVPQWDTSPLNLSEKNNDSIAISQEFLEFLSSQASSVFCSSLCSQQLHQQDDFFLLGGGDAVRMCTEWLSLFSEHGREGRE